MSERAEKRKESRALNETNQNAIISITNRRPALLTALIQRLLYLVILVFNIYT